MMKLTHPLRLTNLPYEASIKFLGTFHLSFTIGKILTT